MNLPSKFKVEEKVDLNFWGHKRIKGCVIEEVRFSAGKIRYDILVPVYVDQELTTSFTLIQNVDSVFVYEQEAGE